MEHKEPFSQYLIRLRERSHLTNYELAEHANVPESLISGLQNDKRCIGEVQARKIGLALGLRDQALEDFVLRAINTSTARTLNTTAAYPSQLINHLAMQLRALGILPEHLRHWQVNGTEINLHLTSGRKASIETKITYA